MSNSPNTNVDMSDDALMQRVLDLAAKGQLTTHPNPRVACVLVNDAKIVGQGYHSFAGELHAEREALAQAGAAARGAVAYLNFEPCCHQGRTPPCTDALIDAGVAKVVAAMQDPNPLVAGGGFEQLRMAGVEVETGLLEQAANWLNRGFVKRMRYARPWVVLKSAATLDGRTAAFDGSSKWITGDAARHQVQRLRASCSAVITGIGTVLADDPEMNVRLPDTVRQPLRVVLDSQLQLPLQARIIGSDQQLVVFTCSSNDIKVAALTELGVEVIQQQGGELGRLDLDQVLVELAHWQCNEVLVEAGQCLSGAFMQAGLVDELALYYAGSVLGDQAMSMFTLGPPLAFSERLKYRIRGVQMIDPDFEVSAVNESSLTALMKIVD